MWTSVDKTLSAKLRVSHMPALRAGGSSQTDACSRGQSSTSTHSLPSEKDELPSLSRGLSVL